jgi:hypothetical protein
MSVALDSFAPNRTSTNVHDNIVLRSRSAIILRVLSSALSSCRQAYVTPLSTNAQLSLKVFAPAGQVLFFMQPYTLYGAAALYDCFSVLTLSSGVAKYRGQW